MFKFVCTWGRLIECRKCLVSRRVSSSKFDAYQVLHRVVRTDLENYVSNTAGPIVKTAVGGRKLNVCSKRFCDHVAISDMSLP